MTIFLLHLLEMSNNTELGIVTKKKKKKPVLIYAGCFFKLWEERNQRNLKIGSLSESSAFTWLKMYCVLMY